jgi:hypothetical protein
MAQGGYMAIGAGEIHEKIREAYRGRYMREIRWEKSWRNSLAKFLTFGGAGTAITGVLGTVAAAGMLCFSAPFALPVLIAGIALVVTGGGALLAAKPVEERLDRDAEKAMERDITSYKLVKRYFAHTLPSEQESIINERKWAREKCEQTLRDLDRKQGELDKRKTATLELIQRGMAILETQVSSAQQELAMYKRETEALSEGFEAAARKTAGTSTASALEGSGTPVSAPAKPSAPSN